jgi:hypothetical protein
MNLITVPRLRDEGARGNHRAVVFFEAELKIDQLAHSHFERFQVQRKLIRCAKIFPDAIAASPSRCPPV